eukprot:TRINITY_DN803_c1_g1_i1.p1 TRINITY_DN803_c1_g1~~TRINITY_DN803_c1_g1_i1.p1  ORF type:complete len:372 (+),score=177.02 TRINITY_DN803_c1_g1_i1:59-1174(+)
MATNLNKFELSFTLPDGMIIAATSWGPLNAEIKIIALHGWLDNAATWENLAPLILNHSKKSVRIVCMDFGGHGLSSHRSLSSTYSASYYCIEVISVANLLNWEQFFLMGHSMGGAVTMLVAGAFPDRVQKVILIDALGPFPRPCTLPERFENVINEWPKLLKRQRRVYPNLESCIKRYCENNPSILESSAKLIVQRSIQEMDIENETENDSDSRSSVTITDDTNQTNDNNNTNNTTIKVKINSQGYSNQSIVNSKKNEKGYCFRHDPKLTGHEMILLPESDVADFLFRISAPILGIYAQGRGDTPSFLPVVKARLAVLRNRIANGKTTIMYRVPGNHHLHLDNADEVYEMIVNFVNDNFDKLPTSMLTAKL